MKVYLPPHLHANEISISNCLSFAHRLDMVVVILIIVFESMLLILSPNVIWLL